jgi:hypothetical protein
MAVAAALYSGGGEWIERGVPGRGIEARIGGLAGGSVRWPAPVRRRRKVSSGTRCHAAWATVGRLLWVWLEEQYPFLFIQKKFKLT